MPKINTKDDMKKYIALRLGAPISSVEIENEQYEIIIDDAVQLLQTYNYGDGSYFEYACFEMKAGQNKYFLRDIDNVITSTGQRVSDVLGDPANLRTFTLSEDPKAWENTEIDIEQIFEVKCSNNYSGGINTMFTPMHSWWYSGGNASLVGGGMGNTGSGGGAGSIMGGYSASGANVSNDASTSGAGGAMGTTTGSMRAYDPLMGLSNYQWMMDYISSMEYYFKTLFQAHWRKDAGILQIYPVPKRNTPAIMTYYKKENAIYLYNNVLFKQLVVASAKMQWGTNLGKFTADLAGGGSVNYSDIKQEGAEEFERIMETIKLESQPPDFMIG